MTGLPIKTAMVLAAGLGKRMRPLTDHMPKPLIKVAGKPLLDHGLDLLAEAGVEKAIVNVHYLPDRIVAHVANRTAPRIEISDERVQLLDSAGGIAKALPQLGGGAFFVLNADSFWIDDQASNLRHLALAWNDKTMDILLMLAKPEQATGHERGGDFRQMPDGGLVRARNEPGALIYVGAAIAARHIFEGMAAEPKSLNTCFDNAIAKGRLHGMTMAGHWITVGTPDAVASAENAVRRAPSA